MRLIKSETLNRQSVAILEEFGELVMRIQIDPEMTADRYDGMWTRDRFPERVEIFFGCPARQCPRLSDDFIRSIESVVLREGKELSVNMSGKSFDDAVEFNRRLGKALAHEAGEVAQ